jgi:hypothetical protein
MTTERMVERGSRKPAFCHSSEVAELMDDETRSPDVYEAFLDGPRSPPVP